MTIYNPDAWQVVKITSDSNKWHYRVFAGWYGGYAGSDSWKLNSGITQVDDCGDWYDFHGASGSMYRCSKNRERMTGYMAMVYETLAKNMDSIGGSIEQIDMQDFTLDPTD